MISSRWPRPTFVIESIALMPVCSGCFTGWRLMTPGAFHSSGRDAVLQAVDAGDAVAELDDVADLGEVGLGVEVLDPLAQDRRDLFGTKLQKVLLVRSWRRRSSRPRTLASSLIDPAWRTIPPIK